MANCSGPAKSKQHIIKSTIHKNIAALFWNREFNSNNNLNLMPPTKNPTLFLVFSAPKRGRIEVDHCKSNPYRPNINQVLKSIYTSKIDSKLPIYLHTALFQ